MSTRRRLKGSDVYLLVMFTGWVAYVVFNAVVYHFERVFLPDIVTIATAILFLYEAFALYRLRLAREDGKPIGEAISRTTQAVDTIKGWAGSKLGLSSMPDVDIELDEAITKATRKEEVHEDKQTD